MTRQEGYSNRMDRNKSTINLGIVVSGVVLSTVIFFTLLLFSAMTYQRVNGVSWVIGLIGAYFIFQKKISRDTAIKPSKSAFRCWLGLLVLLWGVDWCVMFGSVALIGANPIVSKMLSFLIMSMIGYCLSKIFENSSFQKKKGLVPLYYSILFIMVAIISFFAFFFGDYALVYNGDGYSQHYTLFKNFREELLALIRTGAFPPMWDWSYGIGSSWFSKYVYYNLGDVFSYLSILSPTKYLAQWFSFLVLFRAYLAGLAYYSYAKRKLTSRTALIVTSLTYAFSPLVIMNITRHPFFINVMIIFPLLLLGIDKVMKEKKIAWFIMVTIWAIVNNFYFAWLLAIGGFVYLILNYIYVYRFKESVVSFFKPFLIGLVLIVGLISIYIIPVLINVKMMSRGEDIFANDMITYNLRYYLRLPLDLINMNGGRPYRLFGGYSVVFVLALVYLIRRRKNYSILLMSLVLGGGILISPPLASVMSGFGSPIHRWMLLLNLPVALAIGYLIENIRKIDARDILSSVYIYGLAIGLSVIGENFKTANFNLTIPLVFIAMSLILVFCSYSKIISEQKIRYLLALVVILNVFVNVWSYHSIKSLARIDKSTNTVEYLESGIKESFAGADRMVKTSPSERLQLSSENRISPAKLFKGNTSSLLGVHQLNSYNSIQNKYINEMLVNDFGNKNFPTAPFVVIKDNPTLLRFMGVKYYVSKNKSYIPSGYKKMNELENNVILSETQIVVPFAYTSDKVISEERTGELSQPERLAVLLDSVVTSDASKIKTYRDQASIERVSYKIRDNKTKEIVETTKDNTYHFLAGHSYSVILEPGSVDNKEELYVSFKSATPNFVEVEERLSRKTHDIEMKALAKGELAPKLTPYERLKFYTTNAYIYDDKKIRFTITGKKLTQLIESDGIISGNGYRKIVDQSYYLGKGNNNSKVIQLKNSSANDLIISKLEFLKDNQSLGQKEEKIKVLDNNKLRHLKFLKNQVSGTIKNESATLLATKIPYHPGWTATVNGKTKELKRVNYGFVGLDLSPGENKVVFSYKEPGLLLGTVITVGTLVLLFIIFIYSKIKKLMIGYKKNERG
ncbi:YfhO family protein [Vagococcus fessus]|uniref:Uncharacterized protein n=1 Tax=Vagococcus fessus TaxID=120370 RepID=A0A430A6I6_9ENTE|nr:YfhO family protein [Vagococcus fessus]RSU02475.1 hypothetical protein CBF31_08900 [Vagococcus fessus]